MNEATSSVAPVVVLFFLIGAFAIMLGARDFGKKVVGAALLAGAAIPTMVRFAHWFLVEVVPVVEVGLAVLMVAAIITAIVRFTVHKRKLAPPGSLAKLTTKRRLEGE